MFSSALASGQLGPLMNQFGLPAEAVDAANKGGQCFASFALRKSEQNKLIQNSIVCSPPKKKNHFFVIADVEAFAKAMETETKSDQDGDSKDKKDEDEDMSLD